MVDWPLTLEQNIRAAGVVEEELQHVMVDRKQRKGIQEGSRARYSP
jgi:hypothetical protein